MVIIDLSSHWLLTKEKKMPAGHTPIFWRDARLPHVELRKVADGREVCYALHSHNHWSLGAIIGGQSTFVYRDDRYHVRQGELVLMNPEWAHACNPIENQPWAYLMLYVETDWVTDLRHGLGLLEELHHATLSAGAPTDVKKRLHKSSNSAIANKWAGTRRRTTRPSWHPRHWYKHRYRRLMPAMPWD